MVLIAEQCQRNALHYFAMWSKQGTSIDWITVRQCRQLLGVISFFNLCLWYFCNVICFIFIFIYQLVLYQCRALFLCPSSIYRKWTRVQYKISNEHLTSHTTFFWTFNVCGLFLIPIGQKEASNPRSGSLEMGETCTSQFHFKLAEFWTTTMISVFNNKCFIILIVMKEKVDYLWERNERNEQKDDGWQWWMEG